MRAVILAAGMATRLRPLTDSMPKCLLDIGGKPLLGRALQELEAACMDSLVMVTGYRAQMIHDYLGAAFPNLPVSFVHNERYAETNNAYSLLLAEEQIAGSEFLLLDSDILFPAALVMRVMASPNRPVLALAAHACGAEEMKVALGTLGSVADIGKDLEPATCAGESIGVEAFGPEDGRELFAILKKRIIAEKRENEFYEASFREAIMGGRTYHAVDTSDCPAIEIDSAEDLERARAMIMTGVSK